MFFKCFCQCSNHTCSYLIYSHWLKMIEKTLHLTCVIKLLSVCVNGEFFPKDVFFFPLVILKRNVFKHTISGRVKKQNHGCSVNFWLKLVVFVGSFITIRGAEVFKIPSWIVNKPSRLLESTRVGLSTIQIPVLLPAKTSNVPSAGRSLFCGFYWQMTD